MALIGYALVGGILIILFLPMINKVLKDANNNVIDMRKTLEAFKKREKVD